MKAVSVKVRAVPLRCTTYYWMAGNVCDPPSNDCANALSDVWTFTTGDGPVKVQSTTWGAIKSLYR